MASGSQNMTTWEAKRVIGSNNAANPSGALLESGTGRANSAAGDTWIFLDSLGGTSSPYGIKHDQADNLIVFIGDGTVRTKIFLGESKVEATTFAGNASTASKWQTARTLTIGATGKDVDGSANVSWSMNDIMGSSDSSKFYRGDKTWSDTLTGPFNVLTQTSVDKAFSICRGSTSEATKIWVDDSYTHFYVENDETTANIEFRLHATDTESGGGANANTSYVYFLGQNNKSTIQADIFNKGYGSLYLNSKISTRPSGAAITQPSTDANPVELVSFAASGSDVGIVHISNDGCYICNSADVGWAFAVFDTDKTVDFSNAANASFYVKQNQEGAVFKGTVTAASFDGNATTATHLSSTSDASTFYRGDKAWASVLVGPFTIASSGSNRANLNLVTTADQPNDFYLGANNTNKWSITCRASNESYMLGFYSTLKSWVMKLYHDTGYVSIPIRLDTAWLRVVNNSSNNSDDAMVYLENKSSNDWGMKINCSGYDYGLQVTTNDNAANAIVTNGNITCHTIWANTGTTAQEREVGVENDTVGSLCLYADTTTKGLFHTSKTRTGYIFQCTSTTTTFYGALSGNASSADVATYASSYLANRGSVSGSSHAEALKAWFNSNKSTEPRNCLTAHYSSAHGNGSMCFGYWLSGYDSNPYGGFYVCHYDNPRYVGIQNGTYTQHDLVTCDHSQNFTGNKSWGTSGQGGVLYGGATNGGLNSMRIGDDVYLGDCNAAGILGMKSTSSNCGFYFYNSSGTKIGELYCVTSQIYSNIEFRSSSANAFRLSYGSYGAILRNDGESFYILFTNSGYSATGSWNDLRPLRLQLSTGTCWLQKAYGAVWNDYAEFRSATTTEPGRVIYEQSNGIMALTTERLQPGAKVVSDTYGFAIGQTKQANTPIAVSGRALVYPYRDKSLYELGAAVCSAPNGTVDIMTREEIMKYPERIVGTVSEIPTYTTWKSGLEHAPENVPVKGRIWIYVR